ncbi:MAG: glycosyltransferase [Desulforegulaceae bacterium]|nr:glycosyltransferase [Desulforegulaceae bacterium]
MKPLILFNCTTNVVGGGVKNSAIFIKHALIKNQENFIFAVSPQVNEILERWNIKKNSVFVLSKSPAKSLKMRKKLFNISNKFNVDCVFTMAGPSYVKFNKPHIMGISNAYITHPSFQAVCMGKTKIQIVRELLLIVYRSYYSLKADFWIFQTNTAAFEFAKKYLIDKKRIKVVSNSIGLEFNEYFSSKSVKKIDSNRIKVFCPSAAYPHKCLDCIPELSRHLIELSPHMNFEFILTLEKNSDMWEKIEKKANKYSVADKIKNIGPFNYADASGLYEKADIIFVPSILETFSASYLEAFSSKKPLIAADKKFARDICKNAALYINPFELEEAALKFIEIAKDEKLLESLTERGLKVLNEYRDQQDRFNKIYDFLKNVIRTN